MAGPADQSSAAAAQRLDKWLFFTRLAKTRSLAQTWISAGHVTVNGETRRQPSQSVRPGDRIVVSVGRHDRIVVMREAGARRGPYEEARLLYDDETPPPPETPLSALEMASREAGSGRPTKRDRRLTDRLKSGLFED